MREVEVLTEDERRALDASLKAAKKARKSKPIDMSRARVGSKWKKRNGDKAWVCEEWSESCKSAGLNDASGVIWYCDKEGFMYGTNKEKKEHDIIAPWKD